MAESQPGDVELYSADLITMGAYDEACANADAVIHAAAQVDPSIIVDPWKDMVEPSTEGVAQHNTPCLGGHHANRDSRFCSISLVLADSKAACMDLASLRRGTLSCTPWPPTQGCALQHSNRARPSRWVTPSA